MRENEAAATTTGAGPFCQDAGTSPVTSALFALLSTAAPGKSVSPEAVARAAAGVGWRRVLAQVRAEAIGLARQGRIVVTRHGRPADPNRFKGVYRLRLPLPGDVQENAEGGAQGPAAPNPPQDAERNG